MKEKDLKRLSREELLELLLIQTKESERLEKELEKAKTEHENRRIDIEQAGTLADASVRINGVFNATEAAAKQYLENIVRMEIETREKCRKILEDAEYEAERIKKKKPKDSVTDALLEEIYDFIDEE